MLRGGLEWVYRSPDLAFEVYRSEVIKNTEQMDEKSLTGACTSVCAGSTEFADQLPAQV